MRFRGIRYGRAERFGRPVAEAFAGPADHGFGDSCPQLDSPPGIDWACARLQPESEDCLNLNVWTPSLDGARPVLVWLHGGGLHAGSASQPLYDGVALSAWGDVVVVTVNHRLNAYGFARGNHGLLDLVLALEWVRDHVAAFGGDPADVTLFGQSGGGAKVAAVLAMPAAQGLVHRAIIQSGTLLECGARFDPVEVEAAFDEAYDGDVLPAAAAVMDRFGVVAFGPRLDADLPRHPKDALPAIPLLVGSTAGEYRAAGERLDPPDDATLTAMLANVMGPAAHDWPRHPDEPRSVAFGRILTEWSRADVDATAAAAPIAWRYSFEWGGAPHGAELPLVFRAGEPFPGEEPAPPDLVDEVSGTWVRFARTGDPGWPRDQVKRFG